MKIHKIFSKKYQLYWFILAVLSFLKFNFLGFPEMSGYENHGIVFWIMGALFTALVFGSILYLIYRLIAGKWNNDIFMILIALGWLIFILPDTLNAKASASNVEFIDYSGIDLTINRNNNYHSKTNDYRIQIPKGWTTKPGKALGVEINAISNDNKAMFSIQVANLNNEEINIDNLPPSFYQNVFEKNGRVSEAKFKSTDRTTLANQPTLKIRQSISYSHLGVEINYDIESYIFIYKAKVYQLILKTNNTEIENYNFDFSSILQSFMLEEYK